MTQTNAFVREATTGTNVYTENGALSYASIGTELLNQFAKAAVYRGRALNDVFADQSALWVEDSSAGLRFPFYLRMITRKDKSFNGNETETVQRGQGVRDEAFKRLLWIAKYHSDVFYKNLWLLPVVGSWKDLWVMMSMDETLDRKAFFKVIAEGINDEYHKELVKKYMPRIRANAKCKTDWAKKSNELAKEFAKFVGWNAHEYRTFKSTGKAHEFQRYICSGLYNKINFNAIPGKALLNLVSGKFLENHNLTETYVDWLKKQPLAKFNGYPYELVQKLRPYGYKQHWMKAIPTPLKITVDRQFDNLIETAKDSNGGIKGNVWCALDTSGSMVSPIARNSTVTSFDVCIGLGIYFSTLNEGVFHKNVIMFDNTSEVLQLKGDFTDMYQQIIKRKTAWGGTNFTSVIEEICRIRKSRPDIPLEDYPQSLVVVSDNQFNAVSNWCSRYDENLMKESQVTNYENAKTLLRECFPSEWVENFKFIWWQVNGRVKDYPSNMDCGGCYNIAGFDGAIISLLLGGEVKVNPETGERVMLTMEEVVEKALHQEVLNYLSF